MKPNLVLSVSTIFLALSGLAFLFAPDAMTFGTLGNASPAVITALRAFGGVSVALGILNWMARNAEASTARDAIFLGNTFGFALTAVILVLGFVSGAPASILIFAVIDALFAIGFFIVGRANMSKS
jgi:hypothetical protein